MKCVWHIRTFFGTICDMSYLILVRHGESRWNTINKFTGWVDVPLSENGVKEAMLISKRMKDLRLDTAFTSHLERAHETMLVTLAQQDRTGIFLHEGEHGGMRYSFPVEDHEIPVHTSWMLNERHYGLLQGLDKWEAAKKYGHQKVLAWRRSFDGRPPRGESLHDVYDRVVPYFKKHIMSEVRKEKNVVVVAHGNSLRAMIKYIDRISDEKITFLELEPATPFIYAFENKKLVKSFENHSFARPIFWEPGR